jgi:hypothetical protein
LNEQRKKAEAKNNTDRGAQKETDKMHKKTNERNRNVRRTH